MIQPLRAWHRRVFVLLSPVLPAILAAAVLSRHTPVPANPLMVESGSGREWRTATVLRLGAAEAPVRRSSDGRWVRFDAASRPAAPDVLVYWSASAPADAALPAGARLLGSVSAALPLPQGVERAGFLVAYSLAHQEVAGSIRLEDLP